MSVPIGWLLVFLLPRLSFQARLDHSRAQQTHAFRAHNGDNNAGADAGDDSAEAMNGGENLQNSDSGDGKIWDWKGMVGRTRVTWPSGHVQTMKESFIALAGRVHSSACKLAVHSEASVQMTQSVKQTKETMIGQVKGLMMMLCIALNQNGSENTNMQKRASKSCLALGFNSAEGVQTNLRAMSVGKGNPDSNDAAALHLIPKSQQADLLKLLKPNGPVAERITRLTKKIFESTKVYVCLANHEAVEYYSDKDQARATGRVGKFKDFFRRVGRGYSKTPLQRLSAKLAKSESNKKERQNQYVQLLENVLPPDALNMIDCESALLEQELLVMKGNPETRIGSVDLMSFTSPEGKRRREVKIKSADEHSITMAMWDTLLDKDNAVELAPIIMKIEAPTADHVESLGQSAFVDLKRKLASHIKNCVVEKVGVFNVQMQSRLKNKFTWSEQNSWKFLLFSKFATELMTKSVHGGYDLYGDPQELVQPCKWKARAMSEGKYRPISNLMQFAKDVSEVASAGENLSFMNVETDDSDSFLWMDDEDKIVMPEWARAQAGIFSCEIMDCRGRDLDSYVRGFSHDVRGLVVVEKALPVLETLADEFGWSMDPLLSWHLKLENKSGQAKQTFVTSANIPELKMDTIVEPLQLSSSLVSAIYVDELSSSIPFVKVGELGRSESSSLWSVYDYYEGYRENCFMFDGGSINDANDDLDMFAESHRRNKLSRWFVDVPFGSTMRLCTNSYDGSFDNITRTVVSRGGIVKRDDIVRELLSFFSRDRKHGNPVADHEVRSCRSKTDSLFNTCFQSDSCVENPRSPCPIGYGCDCDVSARGTALKVGLVLSVIAEGTIYMDWAIALFSPLCAGAVTALMMPFLIPACPWIAGALSYIQAPFGTNTPVVIAGISLFMGMSTCGCVPLRCGSGAMVATANANRVCALRHPNDAENLNPLAFVPPPGTKCVQETGMLGLDTCNYRKCTKQEVRSKKIGWDQRESSRRVTEIFNCHSPDLNISESKYEEIFDEQKYIDARPDDKEIKKGLVPRPPSEAKLSNLFSVKFWTKLAGRKGEALRKCFWSRSTRTNLKVKKLSLVDSLYKLPVKLIMSPLCLAKFLLTSSLSVAAFLLDYLMGAAVQVLVSTVKLLEKINVNLQRAGRWWQYCDASGNKLQESATGNQSKMLRQGGGEPSDSEEIDDIESLMNTTNGQMVAELFEWEQERLATK